MNDHTFAKLGFQHVRELIAAFCSCALGKRLALSMKPSTRRETVEQWLQQVREAGRVEPEHGRPPLGGVHDVRLPVRYSARPAPLEPEALAEIAETLAASAELRAWFDRISDDAPALAELGPRIQDLSPIADSINEAIDPRGRVRNHASPKLAAIRRGIEQARDQIRRVFDRVLRRSSLTRMLQYSGSTFHNDRMVLPLKAEHRGRLPGIVHRSSDSGATLFVEPAESVELNNSIIRLKEEESKEITHILRGLTQRVHINADAILSTLQAMGVVDLITAKQRYAKKRNCVCPVIVDESTLVDIHEGRHPLLVELFDEEQERGHSKRDVVPIDVRLGDDFDVLVLTGPNTGGKTVALKTMGLLALMTQCGIPIPVGEGSRMPVFKQIFIDIGDEQSLQQSLSTFSSHLSNQLDILGRCGRRSLVLIDELGAGTDPDEGAAIGRAVISELLARGSRAMVTTHLSALKAVAFTAPRVDNGSVEFDPESLRPTYHLRIGEPGNSNALIIAKRLGMPVRLVRQAQEHLDDTTRALDTAIAGTLQSRRRAERARREAREAALTAEREREEYERNRHNLEREQAAFALWTEWVNRLARGDAVYIRSLSREAKVVRMQLHKQLALVSTGTMDIEVPLRDIERPVEG